MNSTARERLSADLIVDEGVILHAYQDHLGYWTIGCGKLIDKRLGGGITYVQAMTLLDQDVIKHWGELVERFPWVEALDPVRQAVLGNLAFNMGVTRLALFRNTLAAVERGDYEAAARGLKSSRWYTQVQRSRSTRLIQMMRTGRFPDTQEV